MAEIIQLDPERRSRREQPREHWISLPEELVSVVQFGVDHPEAVGPAFWKAIESAVAEEILGEVPSTARGLSLELDPEGLCVRARWREPGRSAGSTR